jgi:hypothetical protein
VLAALTTPAAATPTPGTPAPPQVHVPLPDLSRFDQLLGDHDIRDISHLETSTCSRSESSPEIPVSVFFT